MRLRYWVLCALIASQLYTSALAQTAFAVKLAWDPVAAVSGYNVYRSETSGFGYIRLNSSLVPSAAYEDNTGQGVLVYYYVVTGVSGALESNISNEVRTTAAPVPNRAPTVTAGTDQSVWTNQPVTLTGVGADPDSDPLKPSWLQISGPTVSLSGSEAFNATFVAPPAPASTQLVFRFSVSDGRGGVASSEFKITVNPNGAPTVNAGPDQVSRSGRLVQLSGWGSDPDTDPITFRWSQVSGPAVALAADKWEAFLTAPSVSVDTPLVFRLTADDGKFGIGSDEVTITVGAKSNAFVLIPLLSSKTGPEEPGQTLNTSVATSLALLNPPVGTVDPDNLPREAVKFLARNEFGSLQEDPSEPIYWGQQVGLHADNLINLPSIRNLPSPASLEVISRATSLKGFFLAYSNNLLNMDGVTADFELAKKLVLLGLRYRTDSKTGKVIRQTHVFLCNPKVEPVTAELKLVYTRIDGTTASLTRTMDLKPDAAFFTSIDALFESLTDQLPGFELPGDAHLTVQCTSEVSAMLAFEDGQDAISALKAIVPVRAGSSDSGVSTLRLFAPFVTLSRPSGKTRLERFDSWLTLFNADPTSEAFVTVKAFAPTGQPLFPNQPSVELTIQPGRQVVLPVLKRDSAGGLFSDDLSIPGPDPRNGYLEIVATQAISWFGNSGTINVHGFVSTKFSGANETIIPLSPRGLAESYFMHVAHNPGQGPYRTALSVLNPSDEATTMKVEVFETNSGATLPQRQKLGRPSHVGRMTISGRQQLIRFIDEVVPTFTNQLGGYIRLTSENPNAPLITFCTYFVVDESQGFVIHSLASINAQGVER